MTEEEHKLPSSCQNSGSVSTLRYGSEFWTLTRHSRAQKKPKQCS